jgi:hypothetical protein
MSDLKNPTIIWLKGLLFLVLGILASALLLFESPSFRVAVLLAIAVWAFCRSYYFAFYVIEHYVDSSYKFTGLISFVRYMMRRKTDRVET